MNFVRRLLSYLFSSPEGVRQDHCPSRLWRHVRPSPADVARDEEFLERAGGREVRSDGEPFERLLTSWRAEIDASPMGELVDTGTALAVIAAAKAGAR